MEAYICIWLVYKKLQWNLEMTQDQKLGDN